tara:strand:+ start:4361 stop:6487 length:2127 start_codon:yes stop_codon:yes gene_type:complete
MGSHSTIFFTVFLISSIILISSISTSFADEIIASSIGFENSTILELKNNQANSAIIDSVRIWLNDENEFKSFKTEEGWLGKKQLNGVIIFTSDKQVKPGETVKFGIKTISQNPTIIWKALDSNGEVISSAKTKTSETNVPIKEDPTDINKPKIISVKEESSFRFIPEKPTSNSEFRVIGENFVPNKRIDFYIGNELSKTLMSDNDGKILFTANTPINTNDERIEFILRGEGGNEKTISLRIPQLENREIAEIIKLSIGKTPQQVKRGDSITLEGMATPNTTLTISSKESDGGIISIDTIQVGFDGKWKYDNLISPELDLGQISIEISDGKSVALRNLEVISAKLINISSIETMYEAGDIVTFSGTAIPNQDMSVILEDGIGAEIFSRTVSIGENGNVDFTIEVPRGSVEGTYVLLAYQGNEEGVTTFGIGQEPEPILILRPTKLNFSSSETAQISIQGPPNAQISLILIDSADREKFSDTINLGPDGKELYKIETSELPTGAFTLNAKRGESGGSAVFTIGLTTGSGAISLQTTRDEYKQGEQILILGNTGSINVLLDISIIDSSGNVIKKINTFSDRFGVFKIDNFRIPLDGIVGEWTVNAKSGGNFKQTSFVVSGEEQGLTIFTDKDVYRTNELININGAGARLSATIILKIYDSEGLEIDQLNITTKSNGEYATIWQIPPTLEPGEYEIKVDDSMTNSSTKFTIN